MGGVGALPPLLLDQLGLRQASQSKVEQLVGTTVLSEPVAAVAQHTVVEARNRLAPESGRT